jgi:hypothetical protein
MDEWRDALRRGITYLHEPTHFVITGGVDDVWQNSSGELMVVDYKATSKDAEVTIDADWQIGYKRQIEIYQWLFRRNGFQVSRTGYFFYCNGNTDKESFDGRLEFDIKIIPYEGDDSWVESAVISAHRCLSSDVLPAPGADCDFCRYRKSIQEVLAEREKTKSV